MTQNAVFWLRDDFRIEDNPALSYASSNHNTVSALYIYDKSVFDDKREAQKWWLSRSLEEFKVDLEKYNICLEIVEGNQLSVLKKIKKSDNISVYWNKVYEPLEIKKDNEIIQFFQKNNIAYKNFRGNVLNEFQEVKKGDGTPFKVYSPFWKNSERIFLEKIPNKEHKVKKLKKIKKLFKKNISCKNILPNKDWYKKFDTYWQPSETTAKKYLEKFIKNDIYDYGTKRDFPSIKGTSKLSPFIRNGQIGVKTIYDQCAKLKSKNISVRKYINELGWREFSHSLINYFPQMLKGNLRKEFDKFPWINDKKKLSLWKKGLTGYPIVDAGMRELYETGWMHNRIRMVVGSFLVKHLRINWQEGEKYFRNCLFDFNEANNVAQWQWVAGCGADAAPYFRIFNPILQGEKFDKEGEYVKKWVPELKKVPQKFIHKPWEMEKKYQEAINTVIGKDYPKPIVIHEVARKEALEAFQSLKKKN